MTSINSSSLMPFFTRAVLPVMRKQRAGHIVAISSSAGIAAGFEFVSAYAASKFGLEAGSYPMNQRVVRIRPKLGRAAITV
jgi:NAD(P)-dependent dehydrogenase (short-subunit alcohol dehydrogenase family)